MHYGMITRVVVVVLVLLVAAEFCMYTGQLTIFEPCTPLLTCMCLMQHRLSQSKPKDCRVSAPSRLAMILQLSEGFCVSFCFARANTCWLLLYAVLQHALVVRTPLIIIW